MKKIELLAPVGSYEALKAAVYAKADAVYFGCKTINARINAKNFNNETIKQAIEFARIRGVKVYITLNTILFEKDFNNIEKQINDLHNFGANAIIVQDIGLLQFVKENTNMPVHASTQMGINTLAGLDFLSKNGVSRAVVSRELSLNHLEKMCKYNDVEIESFVHGALCSSFSGQCLYSYVNGKRSGNRGECAQPCRLKYSNNDYVLSTKDIMMLENIPDLINTGITSLKIEGRIKRPEYAYVTTSCYRQVIDAHYNNSVPDIKNLKLELQKIYNRGGFSTGYYYSKNNIYGTKRPNHLGEKIGTVTKKTNTKLYCTVNKTVNIFDGLSFGKCGMEISDLYQKDIRVSSASGDISFSSILKEVTVGDEIYRTTDSKQINDIRKIIEQDDNIKFKINGKCEISDVMNIELDYNDLKILYTSPYLPQLAKNKPITVDDVKKSLEKTGNSIFEFQNIDINIIGDLFVPLKEINELRRNAFEMLKNKIIQKDYANKINKLNYLYPNTDIKVSITENGKNKIKGYDYSFTTNEKYIDNFDGIVLPSITFDEDLDYIDNYINKNSIVICNNIGQVEYFLNKCRVWAGIGLNVTNNLACKKLLSMGVEIVIKSIEVKDEIKGAISIKEGKIPVMNFVMCPKKAKIGCNMCSRKEIKDDKGNILDFRCRTMINNTSYLLSDYKSSIGQVNYFDGEKNG